MALSGQSIKWYRLDGSTGKSSKVGENESLLRAYPDGALLQVRRGRRLAHVFVPFRGHEIDFERRTEVRSWDDGLWRAEPVRSGNMMVWNTPEGLNRFDLKTGGQTSVVIENDPLQFNHRKANAEAFDGKLVLLGSNVVVDAVSGKRIATNWNDERINGIVLTHDRIGYRIWDGDLAAVDLEHPRQKPMLIAKGVRLPIAETEKGILVWSGKRWSEFHWHTPEREDTPPADQCGESESRSRTIKAARQSLTRPKFKSIGTVQPSTRNPR